MTSSNLVKGAGINNEVGCDFSEDAWKQKSPPRFLLSTSNIEHSQTTAQYKTLYLYYTRAVNYFHYQIKMFFHYSRSNLVFKMSDYKDSEFIKIFFF